MRCSYRTMKGLATDSNLKRITVDQVNTHLIVHEHITLIDISYDDPRLVKHIESGSNIPGSQEKVMPLSIWKMHAAVRGAVEFVQLSGPNHLGHQKATGLFLARVTEH